jgi:DNA-directed RNA polymerase alpha subunit
MWESLVGRSVVIFWKGSQKGVEYRFLEADREMHAIKVRRSDNGEILISPFADVDTIVVESRDAILAKKLEELLMSNRVCDLLHKKGCSVLGDIPKLSEARLKMDIGFGDVTVEQIKKMLALYGLKLGA